MARLPVYLRALTAMSAEETPRVSSEELAAMVGVGPAKLRKDLSYLGSYGTRGVGYEVDYLIYQISRQLGLSNDWRLLIVGAMSVIRWVVRKGGSPNRWLAALVARKPKMVAAVALANKMARMIWAVTTKQEDYRMA